MIDKDDWNEILEIRIQVNEKTGSYSFPIHCPRWLFNLLSKLEKR